jgi:hypothetical protein
MINDNGGIFIFREEAEVKIDPTEIVHIKTTFFTEANKPTV